MPDDIRSLAREILRDPVTIQVGESAPVATVSHALYPVESHRKTALLMKILEKTETESVLVFTRTKDRTTRVARQMKKPGLTLPPSRATCHRISGRRPSTASGTANTRFSWPPTSPPGESMFPGYPTWSITTCPTPPTHTSTGSAEREGLKGQEPPSPS